jgi:LacI family transcriptional regulator
MEELHYVPNHFAAGLRSGLTRTLSLIVPDISNYFFAQLAKGVEDAADAAGYAVVLCNTDFQPQREDRCLRLIPARAVDGLIYAAGAPPDPELLTRLTASVPLVLVDEEIPSVPASTVTSDNTAGGLLVGQHLRELGHRQVLYLGGPERLATTHLRLAGFRQAYDSVEDASVMVRFGDYREDTAYAEMRAILNASDHSVTAVFAGNDLMAIGAVRAIRECGLRIPEEMAVVGYDDIPPAAHHQPPLTTVRQPVYRMGMTAAHQLLLAIKEASGAVASQRTVLPVELLVRASTRSGDDATMTERSFSDAAQAARGVARSTNSLRLPQPPSPPGVHEPRW